MLKTRIKSSLILLANHHITKDLIIKIIVKQKHVVQVEQDIEQQNVYQMY